MWDSLVLSLGLGATAILSALGGLVLMTAIRLRNPPDQADTIFREGRDATVFLFDGETLVDATPSAYRLLSGSAFSDQPWFSLLERLCTRFENLEARLAGVAATGSLVLTARESGGQPLALRAELRGGLMKIALVNPARETAPHGGDLLTVHALDSELQDLRDATNAAPFPMWRALTNGDIVWANAAYMLRLSRAVRGADVAEWPLRRLFDPAGTAGPTTSHGQRCAGPAGSGWFDVVARDAGEGRLFYALPADDTVAAEGALQDFKQTLTNTFAELSTGLAVFDQNRNLQLFNPALADLIQLPVDFLLRRPALFALLDAMRDKNMIPEPKDYRSWRHQMVDLEAAAVQGEYEDSWYLPNGKAFRVVGRPYPNGALALMIDDITDQITRDRLFRVELDMALSVINQLDDAVIVFSSVGQPVLTNAAYRQLWPDDAAALVRGNGIAAVFDAWRAASAPSPFWAEAEAALVAGTAPGRSARDIRLTDGRLLSCRCLAVSTGATAILFRFDAVGGDTSLSSDAPVLALTA